MKFTINSVQFEFSETPGGIFFSKTPITQEQWRAVAEASEGSLGLNPSKSKGKNRPAESVSWHDCQEFCRVLNEKFPQSGYKFRLPTELEWEKACGPDPENLGDYAWYRDNSGDETNDVGLKKPNKFGLYDMLGNVWEWCEDRYEEGSHYRVVRGGSWNFQARYCRAAFRSGFEPGFRWFNLGLRLAAGPVRGKTEVGAEVLDFSQSLINLSASDIRLMLGEMTSQEVRTVKAAMSWVAHKLDLIVEKNK